MDNLQSSGACARPGEGGPGTTPPETPLARVHGPGGLLWFAAPSMAMMLFMGLYTITDTIFVSRMVSTDALSAVNIACPMINVTVGLGTMLAAGGSAVTAKELGEGKTEEARRHFTLLILAGIAAGLLLAAGVLFLDPLARLLGARDSLLPYCRTYLGILLLFAPASILQVQFQTFFVTAGRPGLGCALCVFAGCANIILDALLIPRLGIAGAALGTGTGYLIPSIAGFLYFTRCRGALRFGRPSWDRPVLVRSCCNGASEMVGQLSAAVTTFLFNQAMLRLAGPDGVAAVTILIYSQFLLISLYLGFSMGAAPVLSYHYGRGGGAVLERTHRACITVIAAASVLVFAGSMLLAPALTSIFTPSGTAVHRLARDGFRIFPFAFLFCGFSIYASAALTALSDGRRSAILSLLRTFVFLTACLLALPPLMGLTGVWLAVPLAELLTLPAAAVLFRHRPK